MSRSYDQYCPVAYALGIVGERWSLLVVRELLHGPLRYTDLLERVPGCSTNMLALRLRDLEAAGVLEREKLPPPAAATVYALTEDGMRLRAVLRDLAWWGASLIGPPPPGETFEPGGLARALRLVLPDVAGTGSIEIRVPGDVAGVLEGTVVEGSLPEPDVVIETDPLGLYRLLVECDLGGSRIDGDRTVVERLLESLPTSPVVA